MPSQHHSFNILLTPEGRNQLSALATNWDLSRGAVVRRLIKAAYAMTAQDTPTCASCAPCFVPHLHRPNAPAPSTSPAPGLE